MPTYPWLRVFQQAQEESELSQLHARVMDAESAILARLQELRSRDASDPEIRSESLEIRSALTGLLRIKTERLKWPSAGLEDMAVDTAP